MIGIIFLPIGRTVREAHLHRSDLILGAVRGPIRIVGRNYVRLRVGVVEGRIYDAGRHPLGDERPQGGLAGAASEAHPVAFLDAAIFGVEWVYLEAILGMPGGVRGAPRLCPDIIVAEDAPGGEQQREARPGLLVGRDIVGDDELAFAAHEPANVHRRGAVGRRIVRGPLQRAFVVEPVVMDAREGRGQRRDLVHYFRRMLVVPVEAERLCDQLDDLPVGMAVERRHHLADALDAAFGVGEGAVLFEEGRSGQENMRVVRGLVEEQILHDDAFHRGEARRDVMCVGIGLQNVLTLDEQPLEMPVGRGVEHVRDAQSRLAV